MRKRRGEEDQKKDIGKKGIKKQQRREGKGEATKEGEKKTQKEQEEKQYKTGREDRAQRRKRR